MIENLGYKGDRDFSIVLLYFEMKESGKKTRALLSPREWEVLGWLKLGKTSWDISRILGISERTVNYHVNNIIKKLDASNRIHAVCLAINEDM